MSSHEYDGDYFKKTRSNVGLLLTTMRPLWGRWVKIIREYKNSGRLLDIGCGEGYFLQYAEKYYEAYGMDVSDYCISEAYRRNDFEMQSVFYDGLWDTPYLKYVPKILQDIFIKFPFLGFFSPGMRFSKNMVKNYA
jgi:SAM-dependent methyltransferase